MRDFIKSKLVIFKIFEFFFEYNIDCYKAIKHNYNSPFESIKKRQFYKIIISTHTIEKGLSLRKPKKEFGKKKINDVLSLAESHIPNGNLFPLEMLTGAINTYSEENKDRNSQFIKDISSRNNLLKNKFKCQSTGGIRKKNNKSFSHKKHHEIIKSFMLSRSSIRIFKDGKINEELLSKIISLAQSSPSQCNRQTGQVHYYNNKQKINKLLGFQGGSNGFIDEVYNLVIVTSELTGWGGAAQRSQSYVDGALFSMSILMSLHAFGLSSCPLNLAVTNAKEKLIRNEGDIKSNERLIMMIAFGYPDDDTYKVAESPRVKTSTILHVH